MNTDTTAATVETYTLVAGNGRKIRRATRVLFADGTRVAFTERMSQREAIRQALVQRDAGNAS